MNAWPRARAPEAPPPAVQAQPVTSLAALEALAPEWEALARAGGATPFQFPQWLLPWWRHVGRGELAAVALRAPGGELAGLAPLYLYEAGDAPRRLLPIGIATTDYLDVLVRPGWERPALQALAAQLAAWAPAWDVLEFAQLRPGAALLGLPGHALWRRECAPGEPHPVLVPPMARGMAQNLRTARSRAARAGRVEYLRAQGAHLGAFVGTLARLHGRRWSQRGEAGVLADAAVRAWHDEAAPLLDAAGLLRAFELHLDGQAIAALYVLADAASLAERRAYYYIGGFDPAHAALSPGTLLVGHALEQAAAEGLAAFDFLRGSEPYKYRWGAVDRPMWRLRLERRPC